TAFCARRASNARWVSPSPAGLRPWSNVSRDGRRSLLMSAQSETVAQRTFRRVRRLIVPRTFRMIRKRFRGARGIEIGGPSGLFRRWNMWPVYPLLTALDNYNFASRTLWSGQSGSVSELKGHQFIG